MISNFHRLRKAKSEPAVTGPEVSSLSPISGRTSLFRGAFSSQMKTSFLSLVLLFHCVSLSAVAAPAPKGKAFPSRKSSLLQCFDFGFDVKRYTLEASQTGGGLYGSTGMNMQTGETLNMKGVCISWTGSLLGSLIDTDQGFRFGDLVGGRLDQGPGKQFKFSKGYSTSGKPADQKWNRSFYYGRVDLYLGAQAAYRVRNDLDIGLRLFYELGQTFGTDKWAYDHTHKVIGSWVEYGRWVGELQYGGVWNLSKNVTPTRKLKTSVRWFTSDERKFFLGFNYERLSSESSTSRTSITYDGNFYLPVVIHNQGRQQSFQFVGGIMF